jgi:ribonucleoside-triphosphate reductase
MAEGVRKTYKKHLKSLTEFYVEMEGHEPTDEALEKIAHKADEQTRKDTHQAMEGFIHNLNTMHSRGGNQVVFSSINYGTDTTPEGRMVIEELLRATIEGLGTRGEVPVFPIQIFKVKDGISYSQEDYDLAMSDFEGALAGKYTFKAPNFDLLLKACRTTSKALFPNFMFLDTPFNTNEKWDVNDPKRYRYELATMGCRTRVYENVAGEKTSLGRGNLSFTTLNMPRLAIEARIKAENLETSGKQEAIEARAKEIFLESVQQMAELVADQLYERYQYQRTALARQFPFMMGNDVWKGGAALAPNDPVGDVLRQGTLGIGFIGGHNAMVALYGKGHGHSQQAWDTLYEAVQVMNRVADAYKQRYDLNYSVLATPAEGLSGRFTRMDRRKYGSIPGVTDRDYYVNSFHVDVREPITIVEKIKREAPFHAITRGGHITYVELDGEAQKNVKAIAKIVKVMHDEGIGYGSINHPVDTCNKCGYKGVIYDKCPVCQSESILRMRRITGYLTGDLSSWNSAKRAEERDRVKHGI